MEIKSSPLVQLLLEACSEDRKLAMLCYWHLTVECESKNESVKNWFTLVKNNLVEYLRENSPTVHAAIANQAKFRRCLYNLSDEILKRNKANKARKADLRKTLADRSKVADMEGRNGELFLINPEKAVTTLNPNEATVFKSNTAPFLLSFNSKEKLKNSLNFTPNSQGVEFVSKISNLSQKLPNESYSIDFFGCLV